MICPYLLNRAHFGDALDLAKCLPDESVNCIVTSPAYFGLRDYGVEGQWGLEATLAEYVERLIVLFRELRRVLQADGNCWLNLGDCYNAHPGQRKVTDKAGPKQASDKGSVGAPSRHIASLKPKDLVGIPWTVAFALRDDGWWLRQDNVWFKNNAMPESVRDRTTRSHEYIFHLTKSARYYYDADAIKEKAVCGDHKRSVDCQYKAPGQPKHKGLRKKGLVDNQRGHSRRHDGFNDRWDSMTKAEQQSLGRNKRSVWIMKTQPYSGTHYATFPEELPTICILAGCPKGGVVLDPFIGSGTTGQVAQRLGRHWIGFDIDPKNRELIAKRTAQQGLFGSVERSATL